MLTPTHNIVSAKMIRHYETIGLIARPVWQENDYLTYGSEPRRESRRRFCLSQATIASSFSCS